MACRCLPRRKPTAPLASRPTAWLFWSEVGWQLPLHPASAMFVSNHPSLDVRSGAVGAADAPSAAAAGPGAPPSVRGCQPTASVYLGAWYDWLCCFSNFHTEHHGARPPLGVCAP